MDSFIYGNVIFVAPFRSLKEGCISMKFFILFALFHLLEGGIIHLKREVKHIDTNNIADITIATEVNEMTSRSFLECVNLCGQTDTCFSVFYKDNQCWFVRASVKFSLNSCFQFKSGSTKAFVGLNEVRVSTVLPFPFLVYEIRKRKIFMKSKKISNDQELIQSDPTFYL